ncbi:ATP-binding cassette domain-containing protein [Arthrobacter alkaliphilus]|uniref:ATP-binding cassette domain-containing protein n=1 Tax=Arthrobacter alkaliphilus TaxID=369936 RepID=UPI001F44E0F1|nr:ABC transporter ATP-binding protein [Arthrobacter alkaliphilus]
MTVTVANVNYAYNSRTQVLHDVSFTIAENQIMGLIGPNGSGKSTLIKVILDLLQLQSGRISIGSDSSQSRNAKMSSIYLSSNDYLPEFLTGAEYVRFMHGLYGEPLDQEELRTQFARYSMRDRQRDLIEDYSHGMRKKLQLIAAFMLRRRFTVIDETLNGIDIDAINLFERDIRTLATDGRSVLLCSHDFTMLEHVADELSLLIQGALVFQAPVRTIIRDHGTIADLANEFIRAMEPS